MVVDVLLLLRLEHRRGTFCFLILFFIFWLGASVLPLGYYVVVEGGCNCYLPDINILFYRKN